MLENVIRFYESYDEEGRLFRDKAHLPEYLTTVRYFDRLFTPGSRILDACAGTGRYALYLADKGHDVTACDLTEYHVNIMKSKKDAGKLTDISVCNALDLSRFAENSFDAVLCMGALYHVQSNDLKGKAVSECARVCKPGGIVALAYLQETVTIRGLTVQVPKYEGIFFCSAPNEIEEIAAKYGLEKIHNIGTDGIVYSLGSRLKETGDEEFQQLMEEHYLMCEDESAVLSSGHCLWMGRKT